MSALRDKYQSVSQFFKDVKRAIEDIVTRLSDVETRIDEGVGGGALPQDEEEVEQETVDPFQYEGPFAVVSMTEGYTTPTNSTFIVDTDIRPTNTSSSGDTHYIGAIISAGAINTGQRRIPISGFGHPVSSSGGGTSSLYCMIPDDYSLYLRFPARKRGTDIIDTESWHEDVFDQFLSSGGTMSAERILVPNGQNPALSPFSEENPSEWVMLAQNRGGKLIQTQFGELNDLPQYHTPLLASSAYIANYASRAGYRGPFHVERAGSTFYSAGELHGYVNIYDNTNIYGDIEITSTNIPYAGHIVQGSSHTVVDGGFMIPVTYGYDSATDNPIPANIYLYKDDTTSTFKYSAIASGETVNPFSGFYTRLAMAYDGAIVQTQFGDIIDVDSGGSITVYSSSIYSSSIYSSTYVDSRTFVTSTYVDSRSYSSTIIMSGGMDYNGAFKVAGGIDSSDPENPFLCSCTDGLGRARNVAGYVIAGNNRQAVSEPAVFPMVDGARVYLVGTPNLTNHTATYTISVVQTGNPPSVTGNQWYTELAYKSSGTLIQNQFGDVVAPYEVPAASNGGVQQILSGINTWVSPADGKGVVTINASSGYIPEPTPPVSSGGMMFPNYANLADASPDGTSMYEGIHYTMGGNGWIRFTCIGATQTGACVYIHINNAAIGMHAGTGGHTTFLPVQSGADVYYTGNGASIQYIVKFDGYATSQGSVNSSTI